MGGFLRLAAVLGIGLIAACTPKVTPDQISLVKPGQTTYDHTFGDRSDNIVCPEGGARQQENYPVIPSLRVAEMALVKNTTTEAIAIACSEVLEGGPEI